jgi:hypothetical protein
VHSGRDVVTLDLDSKIRRCPRREKSPFMRPNAVCVEAPVHVLSSRHCEKKCTACQGYCRTNFDTAIIIAQQSAPTVYLVQDPDLSWAFFTLMSLRDNPSGLVYVVYAVQNRKITDIMRRDIVKRMKRSKGMYQRKTKYKQLRVGFPQNKRQSSTCRG